MTWKIWGTLLLAIATRRMDGTMRESMRHVVYDTHDVRTPFYQQNKSILTLVDPQLDEETEIWQDYYDYLMSMKRTKPFFVYFTSEECEDEDEDEDIELEKKESVDQTPCNLSAYHLYENHLEQLLTTSPSIRIVRLSKQHLPHACQYHRILSYPSLLWFPPRQHPSFQRFAHPNTNWLNLSTSIDQTTLYSFIKQCHQQTNIVSPSTQSSSEEEAFTLSQLVILLAIALYTTQLLLPFFHQLFSLLQKRLFWFLIAQTILYMTFSGFFHSIIHRVHLFYIHPIHGWIFIHPQGRHQFFIEGLIHGSWSFIFSTATFGMIEIIPRVSHRYTSHEIFRMALIVMVVSYIIISILFTSKYRWVMS